MPAALSDLTLEITPPRRASPTILLRRAGCLGALTDRINVIARPDRQNSLEAAEALLGAGFRPVWHLTNRGRRLDSVEADLERAARAGLERVLIVRGEYKAEDSASTPRIREVVRRARARQPGAEVGVTFSPQSPDPGRAWANLWPKLEAGADRVQLQVCFDLEVLRAVADRIHARMPDVAVVPMLMPVLDAQSLRRLTRRLSIPTPVALHRALSRGGPAEGWRAFARSARAIRRDPRFGGLALMTAVDVPDDQARALRRALASGADAARPPAQR